MDAWVSLTMETLWNNALGAIPLILIAMAACRWIPCRPSTRHTLWLMVLIWFVAPTVLPTSNVLPSLLPSLASVESADSAETPVDLAAADPVEIAAPPIVQPDSAPRRGAKTGSDQTDSKREMRRTAPRNRERVERDARPKRTPNERIAGAKRSHRAVETENAAPEDSRPRRARPDTRLWERLAQAPRSDGPAMGGSIIDHSGRETKSKFAERRQRRDRPRSGTPAPNPSDEIKPSERSQLRDELPAFAATEFQPLTPVGGDPEGFSLSDPNLPERVAALEPRIDVEKTPGFLSLWLSSLSTTGQQWLVGLAAIRDALRQLTIPIGVWVTGLGVCALYAAIVISVYRHRIRGAYPAPPEVDRLVRACADAFGMRRTPQALMIPHRVSPMIWCGRRVKLVLPEHLWYELDEDGRRVVVCHELAHIRRRDHWINWLQLVVAAFYWWNPLFWWVRRRLNEEAELCCDAWVTWLFPHDRRAYAKALLKTKQYVSESPRPGPVMGIGVTTGRARRFARRLTMVMTGTERPKLSTPGFALVAALALAGWMTGPALSCPKEKKAEKECESTKVKVSKPDFVVAPRTVVTPHADGMTVHTYGTGKAHPTPHPTPSPFPTPAPVVGGVYQVTPGGIALVGDAPHADDRNVAHQLSALEAQIAQISAEIERLRHALQSAPKVAPAPAPAPRFRVDSPKGLKQRLGGSGIQSQGFFVAPEGGKKSWKTFKLSKGKLEALTELMVRSDVPIYVRPGEDKIEVQGTPREHAIFDAFVRMIDPKGQKELSWAPRADQAVRALTYAAEATVPEAVADAIEAYEAAVAESYTVEEDDDVEWEVPEPFEPAEAPEPEEPAVEEATSVYRDVAKALYDASLKTMQQQTQTQDLP